VTRKVRRTRTVSKHRDLATVVTTFVGFRWPGHDDWSRSLDRSSFTPVWSDPPICVSVRGAVRSYAEGGNRLIIAGHCLGTDPQVKAVLRTADPVVIGRLPGSYSFVLVTAESELVLAADAAGQFPVYFTYRAGQIVFGSRAGLVAGLVGSAVDTVALAADIIFLPGAGTAFCGVDQIDGGMALKVDKNRSEYVHLMTLDPDEQTNIDDAAAQLRTRLVDAVEARVAVGQLSADFSGGLDSTSLAYLAADRVDRLTVLTSRSSIVPVPDDVDRAARYAATRSGFDHVWVEGGEAQLPYQKLVAAIDRPQWAPITMAPLRQRLETAARLGSRVHLVGEAGDLLLGAPHLYLADLARHGELAELWRHCRSWARMRGRSPASLFRRALLLATETRQMALRRMARMLAPAQVLTRSPTWEEQALSRWGQPRCDFLTSSARRTLAAHVRGMAERSSNRLDSADEATIDLLRLTARIQRALRDAVADAPTELHAPYLDSSVIEACLSVPARRRCDPAVAKPLLRRALVGLVPPEVLARGTKGDYTRQYHLGARRAATRLRALLHEPACADLGVVEPGPVRETLERGLQGLPVSWGALNQVFATELWLRDPRSALWEPSGG
jgi:asparagine synthase (glutamine-hydrolysing)